MRTDADSYRLKLTYAEEVGREGWKELFDLAQGQAGEGKRREKGR